MVASQWIDPDGTHIDVRGLPAPEPLVAILSLVQSANEGTTVIVHHERDPYLLYVELALLGWSAEHIEAPKGEVRLRLRRKP